MLELSVMAFGIVELLFSFCKVEWVETRSHTFISFLKVYRQCTGSVQAPRRECEGLGSNFTSAKVNQNDLLFYDLCELRVGFQTQRVVMIIENNRGRAS
jgi:hypothetical protein